MRRKELWLLLAMLGVILSVLACGGTPTPLPYEADTPVPKDTPIPPPTSTPVPVPPSPTPIPPSPTPVPQSPTPIPPSPTPVPPKPFVGGECDPRTVPIQADTSYSEYLEATTESYPANCRHYCLWIPDGMSNLTIGISGFNVDLDLYVGYGELETVLGSSVTYGETYLWKSNDFGTGDEEVGIGNPDGGPYYIEVCSYEGEGSPFQLQTALR